MRGIHRYDKKITKMNRIIRIPNLGTTLALYTINKDILVNASGTPAVMVLSFGIIANISNVSIPNNRVYFALSLQDLFRQHYSPLSIKAFALSDCSHTNSENNKIVHQFQN